MSRFVTKIKVPVEETVKALPNDTFLERVNYDPATGCVELYWENRNFVTPFTTSTEFSIEQLAKKQLPANTRLRTQASAVSSQPSTPIAPAGRRRSQGRASR